ncbi:hypothetical protein E4T45_13784 [Aureobasidium sp. EXF-8846]|nr:hypothetical protein E4T45_13784 [Aureobasidium sp. EXF-8846]
MSAAAGSSEAPTADSEMKEVILDKVSFASNYFFDTGMYFPKGTILALYFKVFPRTMPVLRTTLYFVTGCTVLCCCATFGLDTFYCHNITDNWSLKEGACSTFESLSVFQADWAMEFTTDVFIVEIQPASLRSPFPAPSPSTTQTSTVLWSSPNLRPWSYTIAISLGRFISTEVGKSWNAVYIWSMIQMTVAIIVVSLPALKSLLRRRNTSSNKSGSGTGTRTANGYSSNYGVRARQKIFGALPDDTGSDVELNRIVARDGSVVKTNEVSIDSRPASEERSFSIL